MPCSQVEAFNDIVHGGRNKSPILVGDSDQEFFRIKEQRFAQCMQRFDNGNGTYTITQPIAMAVILALEKEQRNQNYMQVMKEYQKTHIKQIKETTDFTKLITEEVTRNISHHIIQKLSSPIEESKKQIEDHTKVILCKLDANDRILEQHKDHRISRGFLSRTRDEREAELYEARITALSEDNENSQSQHDELTKIHNASKEQISKLMKSSTNWREK
jgi:hypothetical protein